MKLSTSLLLFLSFLSSSVFAQKFIESGTSTPFLKMNFNASLSHFEDFNLDGKLDIIQSGTMTVGSPNLVIYMNMGDDVFDLSPIINETDSLSINNFLVSHFDADQFPDILINGFDFNGNPFLKMLTNDGSGHFDLNTSFDFSPLSESHLVKVNLNADNSADFIIIGKDSTGNAKTNAYLNDGNGNFSIVPNIGLEDIYNGDISASDIDKDGDDDLLICGTNNDGQVISNLFMNNGNGEFIKDTTTFLELFNYNFAKIVDLNGDNLLDIFVSGIPRRLAFNGEPETQTQVFLNKGSGKFETVNTTLPRFSSGTLSLADIDNDNDIDLYISGYQGYWNGNVHYLNSFFLNDGEARFTEGKSFPTASRTKTYASFGDYDLDEDTDLFITSASFNTKLYINENNGEFKRKLGDVFLATAYSKTAFFDADNDNDLDLIVSGFHNSEGFSVDFYLNDGNGIFEEVVNNDFKEIKDAGIISRDLDMDGDQDIIFVSNENSDFTNRSKIKLYLNDGDAHFSFDSTTKLNKRFANLHAADFDQDGDIDLFISGNRPSYHDNNGLFKNDGKGHFKLVEEENIANIEFSRVAYGDFNNDMALDIVYSKLSSDSISILFNNGKGSFTNKHIFQTESISQITAADFNSDGIDDILINSKYLYINKNGSFINESKLIDSNGNTVFFDIDNDSDIDLIDLGRQMHEFNNERTISLNDGSGNFIELKNHGIDFPYNVSIAAADVDGDNDVDLFISGQDYYYEPSAKLYLNTGCNNDYFTDIQTSCDSYKWIDGKEYANSTNTASHIIKREMSCDSVILLDLTINYSDTYTNTVTATGEYQWIDGNTYYQSNNTATYTLTNQSGCDSTVSLNLTLIPLANELETSITIFPNPSGEQLKFDLGHEPEENLEYQIFNTSGLEIKTWESSLKEQVIDIRPLPSGTYIIKYQEGLKSESLKFVKR